MIDSSDLNVHQLGAKIIELFSEDGPATLRLTVMSFGFKYGLPVDSDHVVDVRFLPNPYWVPELRASTGRDEEVRDYVLGQPGATEFVERYVSALEPVLEGYRRESSRTSPSRSAAPAASTGRWRSPRSSRSACATTASGRARCTATSGVSRPTEVAGLGHGGAGGRGVVALGGGHGLYASLSALRHLTDRLTAVVTVADDGGSSGRLRRELGVLPPGDLRMALAALCDDGEWGRTWRDVMQHRFTSDGELPGTPSATC